ncbi:MAG TPA: SLBB domain-containing protein [Pyrinomonadaceae bacterium]|jgi:protein involved in polysaccharide export with SLBB domain
MKIRKFYQFASLFLCVIFWQSPLSAQTPTPAETPSNVSETEAKVIPAAESGLIHLGDLIDVDVVGSLEFDWRGTLNPEGFLDGIEFVENPIFALCRSEEDVAADVAKAYGKILREPKVVVKILDRSNRAISIIAGAVKTPQRLQIKRPIFLNELIIVSGGLTDKASGEIQIFRPQNLNCVAKTISAETDRQKRERFVAASTEDNGSQYLNIRIIDLLNGKKEANPQILNGDIVTILEAQSIYVIGGVASPKRISFRSQITLSRAIDSAGGLAKNADATRITIFRRVGGETKIIEADLEKIKTEKSEDIILQASDIVEVGQSGRDKRKYPPIINTVDLGDANSSKLPLRVID